MELMKREKAVLTAKSDRILLNGFVLSLLRRLGRQSGIGVAITKLVSKFLAIYPNPGPTQYLYAGGLLYVIGRRVLAKKYFIQATESHATSRLALRNQATAFLALRRRMEAIACYEQYAHKNGNAYFAYSSIAYHYRQISAPSRAGRWPMVAEYWQKALSVNSKKACDWRQLGEAWLAQEDWQQALDALKQAESRTPLGWRLSTARRVARPCYRFKRRLVRGSFLEKLVGGFTRRFVDLCRGPCAVQIWYELGYCYEQLGNSKQSQAFYDKAVQNSFSKNVEYGGIGALHAKEKRWSYAIAAYRQAFAENPKLHDLPLRIGHIQRRLGLFREAFASYRTAFNAGADEATSLFYAGAALERNEQYTGAAEQYRAAVDQKQGGQWPWLYYRLGLVLAKAGSHKQACEAFLAVDIKNEADTLGRRELARAASRQPAVHLRSSESESGDLTAPATWWRSGFEYKDSGDWNNAARCFQAALDREPSHSRIGLYLLGHALYCSDRAKEAAQAFSCLMIDQTSIHHPRRRVFGRKPPAVATSYVHYRNDLQIRPQTVVYESLDATAIRGNPRAIFNQRVLFDPDDTWLHVWVTNNPKGIPETWRILPNVVFIPRDCQRYARFLATAEYLINNSGVRTYFIRRPGQRFLNTWHGTPLKTLGRDIKGEVNGMGAVQRGLLQTTHLISPNEHTSWVLLDRYNLRRIYTGKLAETGYPRIDATLDAADGTKQTIRRRLGLNGQKPVVLFAPTWRGTLQQMDLDGEHLKHDLQALQNLGANLIFRGHYFLEKRISNQNFGCTVVPSDIDTNELLSIVDVLVTDYSSICVDYLPRQKPVVYYVYDEQEYAQERGLYIRPDQMPGSVARTRSELVGSVNAALQSLSNKCSHDLTWLNPNDDAGATKRVIDFFFHGEEAFIVHRPEDTQQHFNTAIYSGALKTNGITNALRALLNNLDRQRVNPIMVYQPSQVENSSERTGELHRFDQSIDQLPRVGGQCMTAHEQQCFQDAELQHYSNLSAYQAQVIEQASKREMARMTGNAKLDVVIDYSGYDRTWTRVFAHVDGPRRRIIYLHSDLVSERKARFWNLASTFSFYKYYDALVSVSESSMSVNRENLADSCGIDASKFIYADNVLNPGEIRQRAKEPLSQEDAQLFIQEGPVFITVGRLSVEKDHAKLITAFAQVKKQCNTASLIIIGDGPLRGELNQLVRALDLEEGVKLLGRRTNPMPLLNKADCFVLSSEHEGQGLVLLEAMALDKPIISVDIPGPRNVLANGGGKLVPNSQSCLEKAMRQFIAGNLNYGPAPNLDVYKERALETFYHDVVGLIKNQARLDSTYILQ